jgi:6-pyruvoyltetrahydropterin/6-carboxytetrahydropterin synthase
MGYSITRKFTFDAGHRVYGHESKCAHVHGHTYHVEVECSANTLDGIGRIIDFSVIKQVCGTWIDDFLDHGMLLFAGDPLCEAFRLMGNQGLASFVLPHPYVDKMMQCSQQKVYIMEENPTAENIAKMLYHTFNQLLPEHVKVDRVVVQETPNCRAEYSE